MAVLQMDPQLEHCRRSGGFFDNTSFWSKPLNIHIHEEPRRRKVLTGPTCRNLADQREQLPFQQRVRKCQLDLGPLCMPLTGSKAVRRRKCPLCRYLYQAVNVESSGSLVVFTSAQTQVNPMCTVAGDGVTSLWRMPLTRQSTSMHARSCL
jgi:hypothetical protein